MTTAGRSSKFLLTGQKLTFESWKKKKLRESICPTLTNIRKNYALFEGSQVSRICPGGNTRVSTDDWWNQTDRGKLEYLEKITFICRLMHIIV